MANQTQTEHQKYYNKDNIEVPSCTTIIKLLAKDLEGWANWLGKRGIDYNAYMDETASVGTEAHALAESIIKQDENHQVNHNIINQKDEDILRNRVCRLIELLHSKGYNQLESEVSLSGERYGGTLDLLCYNESLNKYLLLDFKTSKATYPSMFIQLAGYCQLLKEVRNIDVSDVGIILLRRDNDADGFSNIMPVEENKKNLEIFNHLLNIYYLYRM